MIYFLSTNSHAYTHRVVAKALPEFRQMSYLTALASRRLPRATYIFGDVDRLSPWQLELAARLYRSLAEGGARVVNDPAKALRRLPLLKRLKRAGLNSFQVWDAAEADLVDHFPVFIRTRHAHRGVLSDLLHDRASLFDALGAAYRAAFTVSDLIIVQYCAEPLDGQIFRKHSVFRVGDRYVTATSVHETKWQAKTGALGVAGQAVYDEEYKDIVEDTYVPVMSKVFELADIEYGRVDFGMVVGRPEVYEVNTNPHIHGSGPHPFPIRMKSAELYFDRLIDAFRALNTAQPPGKVDLPQQPEIRGTNRWRRLLPGYQWQP